MVSKYRLLHGDISLEKVVAKRVNGRWKAVSILGTESSLLVADELAIPMADWLWDDRCLGLEIGY